MGRILDIAERIILVLLTAPFLIRFFSAIQFNPWLIALVATEMMTVILILIRRPGQMAIKPYAVLIALLGTALPLLVMLPSDPNSFWLSDVMMVTGLILSASSKLALNRRFGVIAANRGVQRRGPYRMVRHPMYLGYMLTQAGYLVTAPSLFNFLLYACAWTAQILRVIEEERFLCQDEAYRDYAGRTRYRLIPAVF